MTPHWPPVRADEIGWLTESEMLEVDRAMIEDLHIELIQMMENAGRNLAELVLNRFEPVTVTVLAGSGGNGGGGLVAARHLCNRGVDVSITLSGDASSLTPVPAHQFDILRRMGFEEREEPRRSDVVIDALIGYSLKGAPRGRGRELIGRMTDVGDRVVALDTPSGLDVTDGSTPGAVVTAHATMTLALPKVGLRHSAQVGELYVADISVPRSVYDTMGVDGGPGFTTSSILRLIEA